VSTSLPLSSRWRISAARYPTCFQGRRIALNRSIYHQVTISRSAPLPGDANEDGNVTDADYTIWADNDGATGDGVPEPMSMTLLAIGALASLRRRRWSTVGQIDSVHRTLNLPDKLRDVDEGGSCAKPTAPSLRIPPHKETQFVPLWGVRSQGR